MVLASLPWGGNPVATWPCSSCTKCFISEPGWCPRSVLNTDTPPALLIISRQRSQQYLLF